MKEINQPVIVAYTLGGTGGGIADTEEELREILSHGLQLSPVGQVLLEKRVGVHTGDSIVVAPSQTLSDEEYQLLRKASIDIINAIEVQGEPKS
nr:hypothetical protein [Clostridioides difficile]